MEKIKVAIIGTGNIGTDILIKLQRSEFLECSMFVGKNSNSKNLDIARQLGVETSTKSIKVILENPECCEIVFDATSANAHIIHAPLLKKIGKYVIDLTPSHIGTMCIPSINSEECLNVQNINLVTCGGQSTIPIVYAISRVCDDIEYIETVSAISSKSAGAGTRDNIDEYIETTSAALSYFSGVKNTKAMIVLNSAEPPINMRNTIYIKVKNPCMKKVEEAIIKIEKSLQNYVPGYKIIVGPLLMDDIITVTLEVCGLGDFIPQYSGNLDIITCAAIEMAERYARRIIGKEGWLF